MTMLGENFDNVNVQDFQYFSEEDGTDGSILETLSAPNSKRWKLISVKFHATASFASVQDLVVYISSASAARHNLVLLSQAMNGVKDLLLQFAHPILLLSDDILKISLPMTSGANTVSITLEGWSVQGTY